MALFDIPERRDKSADLALAKKPKSKKRATTAVNKGSGSIADRVNTIKALVQTHLGYLADEEEVITDIHTLQDYIDKAVDFGYIAIDTETTGLDPLQDDLVGICIYTEGRKPAYIPVGHISYIIGQKVKDQLSLEAVAEQFQKLVDNNTFIVMFNAAFDIRFIKNHVGVRLHCNWDCYLASRCLNENEAKGAGGLKKLHQKYVLRGKEDAFKFDDLFKGLNFALVPISVAYLYAAHDPKITWELYLYQYPFLTQGEAECEKRGLQEVAWVFHNIEMPVVDVVVDMEDTGVAFDLDYAQELHIKYHALLEERESKFHELCKMYSNEITEYNTSNPGVLDNPININSVKQISALLYDIIGLPIPIDKKTKQPKKKTDEETLKNLKNDVAQSILDYREFSTIVGTFIDKMPTCVNKKDGRIHCKFNQYGADTGRFSSQDPNLQNIPSHNKDIRKMFKATDGYVMMSSDFSQQEIKGMAQMCGDEGMIEAFKRGEDFYAKIASVSFNLPYEDCLEFEVDETGEYILDKNGERVTNPAGKERRSQAKSILLGINYGRGAESIAEQLGCTKKKAEKIKDDVFKGFPAIEKFEQDSLQMAEDLGYVTTLWGRKRRLPDLMLPDYEFEWKDGAKPSDDPLSFDEGADDEEVPDDIIEYYWRKLNNTWGNKKKSIFEEANAEGVWIIDNTKKKADAKRQCVNARIQGTAADQSKLAMIALYNNERLKELGFRMLIPVHDEIIAECPKENAREVAKLFEHIMSTSSGEKFTIPLSCDVTISERWYGESVEI